MSSPFYQYVASLIVSLSITRDPSLLTDVSVWKTCAPKNFRNLSVNNYPLKPGHCHNSYLSSARIKLLLLMILPHVNPFICLRLAYIPALLF